MRKDHAPPEGRHEEPTPRGGLHRRGDLHGAVASATDTHDAGDDGVDIGDRIKGDGGAANGGNGEVDRNKGVGGGNTADDDVSGASQQPGGVHGQHLHAGVPGGDTSARGGDGEHNMYGGHSGEGDDHQAEEVIITAENIDDTLYSIGTFAQVCFLCVCVYVCGIMMCCHVYVWYHDVLVYTPPQPPHHTPIQRYGASPPNLTVLPMSHSMDTSV